MFKILLAEAKGELHDCIGSALSEQSVDVDYAHDGMGAYQLLRTNDYDAIILEKTLPNPGAYELCRQVRTGGSDAAVFIINATDSDKNDAFQNGADACLNGPLDVCALLARLRASLRRRNPASYINRFVCGELCLDTSNGIVTKGSEVLDLRPMEYFLLEHLMRNQGRICSLEELWKAVWKGRGLPSDTIRIHINMLRRKLGGPAQRSLIQTVKGRGYKVELPVGS